MKSVQYNTEVETLKNSSYIIWKRLFDITISVILLIVLIPLLLLFSTAILIFSGRPIFFKQIRTGQDNSSFVIWKYRTMEPCKNREESHSYSWAAGVPNEFVFEKPRNQRITKIGKIYRKLSIDELPQLINVLRGEMSLVGPRPEIPEITKFYTSNQLKRLRAKPGITGHAQVNGRSIINHGKKIEYDYYYVDNGSFKFDMKIIAKTIVLVIRGKGAC